jgi:ArsR family transcriptional regulator
MQACSPRHITSCAILYFLKIETMKPPRRFVCCEIDGIEATREHVAALKSLAHLGRLRVFFHLVRAKRPLPANEIQSAIRLPAPTLSHHLESLERSGLIERVRKDRFVLSSVRREMVIELVRLLTACC